MPSVYFLKPCAYLCRYHHHTNYEFERKGVSGLRRGESETRTRMREKGRKTKRNERKREKSNIYIYIERERERERERIKYNKKLSKLAIVPSYIEDGIVAQL